MEKATTRSSGVADKTDCKMVVRVKKKKRTTAHGLAELVEHGEILLDDAGCDRVCLF